MASSTEEGGSQDAGVLKTATLHRQTPPTPRNEVAGQAARDSSCQDHIPPGWLTLPRVLPVRHRQCLVSKHLVQYSSTEQNA